MLEEIDSLVDEVFAQAPQVEAFLTSNMVSHEDRLKVIDKAFGGTASRLTVNFLKVLSQHDRLD